MKLISNATVLIRRRGIQNPFSWMVPLAVGTPVIIALVMFGTGSAYEYRFVLAGAICAIAIGCFLTIAVLYKRTVELTEVKYTESASILGWTLWAETYWNTEIASISVLGVPWDEHRDMHQLSLNLKNGLTILSFVFVNLDEVTRTVEKMNAIIDTGRNSQPNTKMPRNQ